MEALGFMNTMQELWLTPIALIPKDMPLALKQRVEFEESVRMGGEMFIHAAHLKADLVYEVEFEDRREVWGMGYREYGVWGGSWCLY